MRPNQIQKIANLITEDPDLLNEMGGDMGVASPIDPIKKPLNATEIEQQATERAGTADSSGQVADKLKLQQDLEKQQQVERQKMIEPQLQALDQAMNKLNVGVQQGQQSAMAGTDQLGGLDREMTSLNSIIGNLEKQL